MGKQLPSLDASHREFIGRQRIFFAASAAPNARVNVSPRGTDAEFAELESEIEPVDNVFGARQLADRLAASFPGSVAALRLQGFAALRRLAVHPGVGVGTGDCLVFALRMVQERHGAQRSLLKETNETRPPYS